jgi:hypothetical protein
MRMRCITRYAGGRARGPARKRPSGPPAPRPAHPRRARLLTARPPSPRPPPHRPPAIAAPASSPPARHRRARPLTARPRGRSADECGSGAVRCDPSPHPRLGQRQQQVIERAQALAWHDSGSFARHKQGRRAVAAGGWAWSGSGGPSRRSCRGTRCCARRCRRCWTVADRAGQGPRRAGAVGCGVSERVRRGRRAVAFLLEHGVETGIIGPSAEVAAVP